MLCGRLHDVPSTAELSMPFLLLLDRGGRLLLWMKLDLHVLPRQLEGLSLLNNLIKVLIGIQGAAYLKDRLL